MSETRKKRLAFLILLLAALAFRIAIAHWLANDAPEDGKVYSQIARNVLEQHVYSHETEAPFDPSLIRAPGYPLFLAIIFKVFGHTNNGAVRIVQAFIDTASCALVALLAFYWQPDKKKKRATALAALALAAVNPFTTIYAATILAEGPTIFLALAMCVAATIAFQRTFTTEDREPDKKTGLKSAILWWCLAGLFAGLGALFRPDSSLFAAAIVLTVLVAGTRRFWSAPKRSGDGAFDAAADKSSSTIQSGVAHDKSGLSTHSKFSRAVFAVAAFSFACLLVLTPWTIRNWRVFHLVQPLQPLHAEMPGEFVPRGYIRWLKTWIDDQQYIDPFWWELDVEPMKVDDLPDSAFDSADERSRVAALFERYNHAQTANATPSPPPSPTPSPTSSPQNSNEDTANENDNSSDQSDENDNAAEESDESKPEEHGSVKMTAEIDAGFAQLAAERIARRPFRFYVWVPAKRAHALWFNTHSDFYPFEGALFPLDDLDHETHQHIWLPIFALLVGIYTVLGVAGAVVLWISRNFHARIWVLLASLIFLGRLAFFSSIESPEPRYVVELFPFLFLPGGIAITRLLNFLKQLRGVEG